MTDDAGISPGSSALLEPGRVIAAKYRVDHVLGRGGMGVVAAGVQLDLERPVAIKFLRPNLAQNARPTQRFAREARAIAKMRSEHVVRVFDVGEEAGVPFIVMERLNGNDLAVELARGPLSVAHTIEYVLQACEAIAEAHSLGIVHRDLKPSNLFLAEGFAGRRSLKVLDFGISKWLGPAPDLDTPLSTSEGSFIGTPAYVSPEQLTRPESVDQRTDVWALGVVLYQCCSGHLPFEADSVPRLCAQILTAEPKPFSPSLSLPSGLEQVILRCLRRDVDQRCANISELAQALGRFAAPSSLHLLGSISSLSNDASSRVPRPSQAPAASAEGSASPQTTLTFSHEAGRYARSSRLSLLKPRTQALAAVLLLGAGVLLVGGLVWRSKQAANATAEPAASQSLASRTEDRSSAPAASAPAIPLAAPAASLPGASAPRTVAKPERPSLAVHVRPPAVLPRASAAPPAVRPTSPVAEVAPAASALEPATKAAKPEVIDPAELYRH